jgi:hypothetical protein
MSIFRAVPYILMSGGLGDSQCKDRDTIKVQRVLLMARSLAQKTKTWNHHIPSAKLMIVLRLMKQVFLQIQDV